MSDGCYCDYDPPSVWSLAIHKARKAHKCCECRKPIAPGERYEYVWGIWDGSAGTYKTCERCLDLRQWVRNSVPCFCWYYGDMVENAMEAIDEAIGRAPDETRGVRFGFLRLLYKVKRAPRAPA